MVLTVLPFEIDVLLKINKFVGIVSFYKIYDRCKKNQQKTLTVQKVPLGTYSMDNVIILVLYYCRVLRIVRRLDQKKKVNIF